MALLSDIQWFYKDNGDTAPTSEFGTLAFLNEVADYLLTIVGDCQRTLKQFGNPNDLEGFDQILYDDCVELHNRAVDLYNDLMESDVYALQWFRGCWNDTTFHTVQTRTVEDATAQLIEWAKKHSWCMDNPSNVVVINLSLLS